MTMTSVLTSTTMVRSAVVWLLLSNLAPSSVAGFLVGPGSPRFSVLKSSTISDPATDASVGVQVAKKEELLLVCRRLKDRQGIFLIDQQSKQEFQDAVKALEEVSAKPTAETFGDKLVGDWTLLCTTSTTQPGVDESKLPGFLKEGPLQQLRDNIRQATNRYLTVLQVVKKSPDTSKVDRIDHVLEYAPPNRFKDFLENVPPQFDQFNINPLDVSKSKLSLIHTASVTDDLKVKLALKSIVLNVAGRSTMLDPDGKDLLGVNLPWGEFTNTGAFETTYMDDTLRISRGKQGPFEQLRVFVRSGTEVTAGVVSDIADLEARGKLDSTVNKDDEGQDVDETVDPEFKDAGDDYNDNDGNGQLDVSPSDY